MLLTRSYTNPFSVFDDFFGMESFNTFGDFGFQLKDNKFTYQVELPGIKRKQLEVEVKGRHVVVAGESKTRGKVRIATSLPRDADAETLEAKLEDGVLTLSVNPREKEPEQRKLIEVK